MCGEGGVHGEGCMHGRGTCMAGGVHGGGMHGRGMHGGGVHGRKACVAGETATAADGTHPTAMHSCLLLNSLNSVKHLGKTPSS